MNDEFLMQIMQLSDQEKLELIEVLQRHFIYAGEGTHIGGKVSISTDNQMELIMREDEISKEKICLIEFDDHVIYLQDACNA